jgi:diaminopimelate epimerase
VRLDGGELTVEISDELDVTLTGTASRVYAAELDLDFVAVLTD